MAKLKLIAPDARDVPLPNGRWATVEPNGELETDDDHAKALAKQSEVWETVAEKVAAKKDKD